MIFISLLAMLAGAWLLSANRRHPAAYALLAVSLLPLLATQPAIKAAFTWLALVGVAGFVVTVLIGLRSPLGE